MPLTSRLGNNKSNIGEYIVDAYSQRINEALNKKQTRYQSQLPLQKPLSGNYSDGDVRSMATRPSDPNAAPDIPDGQLKTVMGIFGKKDSGFSTGMEAFVTSIEAMKKEYEGLGLPEEVMRGKMESLVKQFADSSRGQSNQNHPQMSSVQGGVLQGDTNGII